MRGSHARLPTGWRKWAKRLRKTTRRKRSRIFSCAAFLPCLPKMWTCCPKANLPNCWKSASIGPLVLRLCWKSFGPRWMRPNTTSGFIRLLNSISNISTAICSKPRRPLPLAKRKSANCWRPPKWIGRALSLLFSAHC